MCSVGHTATLEGRGSDGRCWSPETSPCTPELPSPQVDKGDTLPGKSCPVLTCPSCSASSAPFPTGESWLSHQLFISTFPACSAPLVTSMLPWDSRVWRGCLHFPGMPGLRERLRCDMLLPPSSRKDQGQSSCQQRGPGRQCHCPHMALEFPAPRLGDSSEHPFPPRLTG